MSGLKVLSLFDGMSCGCIALKNLNVNIDRYVAYEIDKYAVKTSKHNFPFIEHMGDVFEGKFSDYAGFDLLLGGSPCTYWSIAQSPDKRETTASGLGWDLFSQYVRALREVKPKCFVYENNKSMSKAIYDSISQTFGFEPICINSALVSAQHRQRLYWVGVLNEDGTYRKADIQQPEDKGIVLRDVLINGYDLTSNDKAYALTVSYTGAVAWNTIERSQRNMVCEPVDMLAVYGSDTIEQVGALPRPNGELSTSQAFRVYGVYGKSVTLKAGAGGAGGKTGLYAIPVEVNGVAPTKATSSADGKTYVVYKVENGKITIKGKEYPIKLSDGYYIIRKLTVSECKSLQTVPEWFEFPISATQAYKCLGNGWTVDVISHLIRGAFADADIEFV